MVITFCFYQFLIGRSRAEILITKVWRKSVKYRRAPIFYWRQYFLHDGPLQMRQYSAGESPPIKAGGQRQPVTWWLHEERTTYSMRRTSARSRRSQLLRTLPGQNSKKMLSWTYKLYIICTCTNILYILLMHIFCRCLTFVDANVLSTANFCRRLTFVDVLIFVDANILPKANFWWRQYFVDA
jgi:hypothetical protein